jgi:hypothetical protein
MNQQEPNLNRIFIVVGVLALVAIGAYFMVVQPKLQQVAQSQAQLDSLKSQYNDLKQVADQKPLYLALIRQACGRRAVRGSSCLRSVLPEANRGLGQTRRIGRHGSRAAGDRDAGRGLATCTRSSANGQSGDPRCRGRQCGVKSRRGS